ncbi:MAG: hypothetical protein C4317_06160 [Acidimicrobiia bacterium]
MSRAKVALVVEGKCNVAASSHAAAFFLGDFSGSFIFKNLSISCHKDRLPVPSVLTRCDPARILDVALNLGGNKLPLEKHFDLSVEAHEPGKQ